MTSKKQHIPIPPIAKQRNASTRLSAFFVLNTAPANPAPVSTTLRRRRRLRPRPPDFGPRLKYSDYTCLTRVSRLLVEDGGQRHFDSYAASGDNLEGISYYIYQTALECKVWFMKILSFELFIRAPNASPPYDPAVRGNHGDPSNWQVSSFSLSFRASDCIGFL
ncbi:uncharacterized protein LOC115741053 [Rhodamnia argentea]|uniref:Uncharacterized protein LOC115741053 n=1 Tax=Rhodamnia argentea TaxID=178133 RepID=A0A8B8P9J0_9MYRT|nr:uncharacterized protein LOC115741053 [Rhodamnia argentea]